MAQQMQMQRQATQTSSRSCPSLVLPARGLAKRALLPVQAASQPSARRADRQVARAALEESGGGRASVAPPGAGSACSALLCAVLAAKLVLAGFPCAILV